MRPNLKWYAIAVASRKELSVAGALQAKSYECLVPLHKVRRVWSDRIKTTAVPLFGGYVFCRFDINERRLPILQTPAVRQIVSIAREPAPIPDVEIDSILAVLANGLAIEPYERMERGDRVVVTNGVFEGVEGEFMRYQGKDQLILTISLIQRSIVVHLDRAFVQPVRSGRKRPHTVVDPIRGLQTVS